MVFLQSVKVQNSVVLSIFRPNKSGNRSPLQLSVHGYKTKELKSISKMIQSLGFAYLFGLDNGAIETYAQSRCEAIAERPDKKNCES